MNSAYVLEAIHMMTRAGIKPSDVETRVLAADLKAIATDELDAGDPTNCIPESESAFESMTILKQRIGGLPNLRGYLNCLLTTAPDAVAEAL